MSLLKLTCKVNLLSEDDMEIEAKYDLGTIAKDSSWVWKTRAVPFEEVYSLIEFNPTKCIVQLYDGEKILVKETFQEVYDKWNELRVTYGQFERNINEEGETSSEDEEP